MDNTIDHYLMDENVVVGPLKTETLEASADETSMVREDQLGNIIVPTNIKVEPSMMAEDQSDNITEQTDTKVETSVGADQLFLLLDEYKADEMTPPGPCKGTSTSDIATVPLSCNVTSSNISAVPVLPVKRVTDQCCEVCGVNFNHPSQRTQHENGKKHRNKTKLYNEELGRPTNPLNTDQPPQPLDSPHDEGKYEENAADYDMNDGCEEDEMKGDGTHMLGFSGFPKKKAQDFELKRYLQTFGAVKYCRIRRKHGGKGESTGVADVLFQNLKGQTNASNAQHIYKDRPCTLTREAFLQEKERIKQRRAKGPQDKSQGKVVIITKFRKGTTKSDIERVVAGYIGVQEVYVAKKGCRAFVAFDTPFNALQFVQNKPRLPGQWPLTVQIGKLGGWRPGGNYN